MPSRPIRIEPSHVVVYGYVKRIVSSVYLKYNDRQKYCCCCCLCCCHTKEVRGVGLHRPKLNRGVV